MLVTVRESARFLGVSPIAVLDLVDAGTLAGAEVNGQQYVDQASLEVVAAGGTQ